MTKKEIRNCFSTFLVKKGVLYKFNTAIKQHQRKDYTSYMDEWYTNDIRTCWSLISLAFPWPHHGSKKFWQELSDEWRRQCGDTSGSDLYKHYSTETRSKFMFPLKEKDVWEDAKPKIDDTIKPKIYYGTSGANYIDHQEVM